MKKLAFLLIIATVFIGCKKESKETTTETQETETTQQKGLTLLKGDFVYYGDAAVLQTRSEVYGVVIDEKMHELDEKVKAYKIEATDMVPVEIRAKVISKPEGEEGWPFRVEIKEIIKVTKPNPENNDVVKLGKE